MTLTRKHKISGQHHYGLLPQAIPLINCLARTSSLPTVDIREMLLRHGTSDFSRIQSIKIKACCHTPTTVYYHPNHHQYVHAYVSKYVRVHIFKSTLFVLILNVS